MSRRFIGVSFLSRVSGPAGQGHDGRRHERHGRRGQHDGGGAGGPEARDLAARDRERLQERALEQDRKSTRLNSSHVRISYAVFCLKKKKQENVSRGRGGCI